METKGEEEGREADQEELHDRRPFRQDEERRKRVDDRVVQQIDAEGGVDDAVDARFRAVPEAFGDADEKQAQEDRGRAVERVVGDAPIAGFRPRSAAARIAAATPNAGRP